jgi:hypothetical protein
MNGMEDKTKNVKITLSRKKSGLIIDEVFSGFYGWSCDQGVRTLRIWNSEKTVIYTLENIESITIQPNV